MNHLFTHIEPTVWLGALLLFLVAYGVSTVIITNKKRKTANARQLTTLYLALKGIRLFIIIGIVVAYLLTVNIETRNFALAATVLYFIYLLFETLFLVFTEKRMKKK